MTEKHLAVMLLIVLLFFAMLSLSITNHVASYEHKQITAVTTTQIGGETYTVVEGLSDPILKDLPDNKKVCSIIFFTTKGVPIIFPETENYGESYCYSGTVWRIDGKWHGTLKSRSVSSTRMTAYDKPTGFNLAPVFLEK